MKEYLSNRIKEKIISWKKDDIYAVSLYVSDIGDNPCEPTVVLGYNTWEHMKSQVSKASGEQEAKWNYAFWLQNTELEFGLNDTQVIVQRWIQESGYQYYTYEEMFINDSSPVPDTYEGITLAFWRVLIEIVRDLHTSGFIREQFGNEIPVLIHQLEYYPLIAKLNAIANPVELIDEFMQFCC